MFKDGDIVVAVIRISFDSHILYSAKNLTHGKSYLVVDTYFDVDLYNGNVIKNLEIFIKDDSGSYRHYPENMFISLREFRKQKLKKLCLK